jgi:hypothetical protein
MGQIGLGILGVLLHFILLGFLNTIGLGNQRGQLGAGGDGAGDGSGDGKGTGAGDGTGDGKGTGTGDGKGSGDGTGDGKGDQQFSVPEAYKEKGWAKKVKTQEELFKLVDSQDVLIGKKTVVPDFEKGDPKDIEAYLAQLRGDAKLEDYAALLPKDLDKESAGEISQLLFSGGLPKPLASKIIAGYAAIEQKVMAKRFSKDGIDGMLKESFGKDGADYKKVAGGVVNFTKELLSEEDQKFIDTKLPNDALGVFYRLAHSVMSKFGVKEGYIAGEGGGEGGSGKGDISKRAGELRKQIADLSGKPHTAADKKKLVDELNALYKTNE